MIRPPRLHVMGGSGSGTTTLGRALAMRWPVPHADSDDYYWVPTTPAYTTAREPAERLRLMGEMFAGREAWVLSGALTTWGGPIVERFEAVVMLTLAPDVRLDRLRRRERERYGELIAPGGERAQAFGDFMTWAAGYDDADFTGRSLARHEEWLATLTCPVLRLDSDRPVAELVDAVTTWWGSRPRP